MILHEFPHTRTWENAIRLTFIHIRPYSFGAWGIDQRDAARLCNDFTLEGKIPEPLRVARLCARNATPFRIHDS